MKTTLYSILAAAACGMAFGQTAYTNPVGYTTTALKTGKFNLLGMTVQQPTVLAGVLNVTQSTTAGTLVITGADFSSVVIAASQTYAVEINSGSNSGTVFEVPDTSFNNTTDTITVGAPLDTTSFASASFSIRKIATIADVFGPANEAGLLPGTATSNSDVLYIPNAAGVLEQYWYSSGGLVGAGWRKFGGGATPRGNVLLSYIDSFYVYRRGGIDLDLVTSGIVKGNDTKLPLFTGYNYIGSSYPAGATLATSNLSATLTPGTATSNSDVVWVPNATTGVLEQYWYSSGGLVGAGWRKFGGGATSQANLPLSSGIIIQRRGAAVNALMSAPPSYDW